MYCERHPERAKHCGCYSQCTECRTMHPDRPRCCSCSKDPLVVKKQEDIVQIDARDIIIKDLERRLMESEIESQLAIVRVKQEVRRESSDKLERVVEASRREAQEMKEMIDKMNDLPSLQKASVVAREDNLSADKEENAESASSLEDELTTDKKKILSKLKDTLSRVKPIHTKRPKKSTQEEKWRRLSGGKSAADGCDPSIKPKEK